MKKTIKKITAVLLILAITVSFAGCGEISKAEKTVQENGYSYSVSIKLGKESYPFLFLMGQFLMQNSECFKKYNCRVQPSGCTSPFYTVHRQALYPTIYTLK